MLKACGLRSLEQQRAWREKMGLLSIITVLMAGVAYLTFGFTKSVCGKPPDRFQNGNISTGSVILHGYVYDFDKFLHPSAAPYFDGKSNPLYKGNWGAAGNDISFLFQKVNQNCLGLFSKASGSPVTGSGEFLDWYFPCNIYSQKGNSNANLTGYDQKTNCHTSSTSKTQVSQLKPLGPVYYTWNDVENPSRNLAVYEQ
jgi:chitin synthase